MLFNRIVFNHDSGYTPGQKNSPQRMKTRQPQFSGRIKTVTSTVIHGSDAYDASYYKNHPDLDKLFTEKKFANPTQNINYDELNVKIEPQPNLINGTSQSPISGVQQNLINSFKSLVRSEQAQFADVILENFPMFVMRAYPQEIFGTPESKEFAKRTQKLLAQMRKRGFPKNEKYLDMLARIVTRCQMEALKYILLHITVAEQLSVAPFSRAQELFKEYTKIQAAYARFGLDEANHGEATRFYLIENLGLKPEQIQAQEAAKLGYDVFKGMANLSPSVSVLLMIGLEVVGSTFFKVFAESPYNLEPHFKRLCRDIYSIDEERHLAISQAVYNAMYGRMLIEDEQGRPVLDATGKPTFKPIPHLLIGVDKYKPAKLSNALENLRNHEIIKRLNDIWYPQYTTPNHAMLLSMKMLGIDPDLMVDTMAQRMHDEFKKVKFDFDPNTFKAIKAKQKASRQTKPGEKQQPPITL